MYTKSVVFYVIKLKEDQGRKKIFFYKLKKCKKMLDKERKTW